MNRKDYTAIAIFIAILSVAGAFSIVYSPHSVGFYAIGLTFGWLYFCFRTRWWK